MVSGGPHTPAFCTIIAKNYLAYARVLAKSLRRHHPGAAVHVLLVDAFEGFFDPAQEDFSVLTLEDLDIPRTRELCFRYDVLELSTAVKPFLLRRLFEDGHDAVVYLDPDIRVYAPLEHLSPLLEKSAVVLTPHLTAPLDDGKRPGEREILGVGAYNLGFLALSRGAEVDRLLAWWAARCHELCVVDTERGLFVDQKWMDLAPGFLDGVHVLRHPGYNVAYWNLAHRHLEGSAEAPRVDGEPLCFFHFSGFDPSRPESLSRHQDRFGPVRSEPLRSLLRAYAEDVLAAGHRTSSRWPYTHGTFSDGHPIGPEMRALLREQPPERFGDPFAAEGSFLSWAVRPAGDRGLAPLAARLYRRARGFDAGTPGRMARLRRRGFEWLLRRSALASRLDARALGAAPLAPLAGRILARRPDVQEAFGPGRLDRLSFLRWLAKDGVAHHHLKASWCAEWLPDVQGPEVMKHLLAVHDRSPDLRRLFPMALVAEHDAAGFLAWIEAHPDRIGLEAAELAKVRRLFDAQPFERIAEIYRSRPDVARAFPRALDDPEDRDFPAWLRYSGRREYGIPEDWVLWFVRVRAQHVCKRLHTIYRSRPDWQGEHPLAFSPFGRRRFVAALAETPFFELAASLRSADRLCPRAPSTPGEDARRWYETDGAPRELFPRAFRLAADTASLLAWLREHGRIEYGLSPQWLDTLEAEAEGLGLSGEGATVVGYLRTESGMGELARATVRALAAVDYPVATLTLDGTPQRQEDLSTPSPTADGPLPFTIVHVNAPETWRLWARSRDDRTRTGYAIGYWAWELGELPRDWTEAFPFFDEIWTCSRYSSAAIAAASPVPVQAVWPAVAAPVPSPLDRGALGLDPDAFTFLFVYDLLSETDRKNPLGLIEAFRRAFRTDDRVRLVVKTSNGRMRRADLARVEAAATGLPVTVMDRTLTRPDVFALMRCCDAYASLHRAEGFGFTLAEAMSAGKPVAATYYSGNVDFMTPWNSFPIPYELAEIPEHRGPYPEGGLWAEPDLDAAAEVLRGIYLDREAAREVGLRGQADVARLLSPEACGHRIALRLRSITESARSRTPPVPSLP